MTAPDKTPDRIAGMFDAIAPRYDLLNHLLSAGIDRRWRARAIDALALTGRETLVDVCTGTADMALESRTARGPGACAARVIGVDFAVAMLRHGQVKLRHSGATRIQLVHGDAMRLPVRSGTAEAATVAFGIRNVQRPEVACAEMARVLKPGGRLAMLEFGLPRFPGISRAYRWYFANVLPRIGRLISGHSAAYSYLPASVGTFQPPEAVSAMLTAAGFERVGVEPLTFGIVNLYTGVRAARVPAGKPDR